MCAAGIRAGQSRKPAGPPPTHLQAQAVAVRRQHQGAVLEDTLAGARLAVFKEQTVQDFQRLEMSNCVSDIDLR